MPEEFNKTEKPAAPAGRDTTAPSIEDDKSISNIPKDDSSVPSRYRTASARISELTPAQLAELVQVNSGFGPYPATMSQLDAIQSGLPILLTKVKTKRRSPARTRHGVIGCGGRGGESGRRTDGEGDGMGKRRIKEWEALNACQGYIYLVAGPTYEWAVDRRLIRLFCSSTIYEGQESTKSHSLLRVTVEETSLPFSPPRSPTLTLSQPTILELHVHLIPPAYRLRRPPCQEGGGIQYIVACVK